MSACQEFHTQWKYHKENSELLQICECIMSCFISNANDFFQKMQKTNKNMTDFPLISIYSCIYLCSPESSRVLTYS